MPPKVEDDVLTDPCETTGQGLEPEAVPLSLTTKLAEAPNKVWNYPYVKLLPPKMRGKSTLGQRHTLITSKPDPLATPTSQIT
jgi:hypothetical protein